jgi:hypothetical protein
MSFTRAILGRTGIEVGRLGLASSYGAPSTAVEQAFDHGVNYFYWGSLRRNPFGDGLRALAPRRDSTLRSWPDCAADPRRIRAAPAM